MKVAQRLRLVLLVAVVVLLGSGLLAMFADSPNDKYAGYQITLEFSGAEPSFVYIWANGTKRMGGLWGIVDGVRTIDFGFACATRNPRLLSHNEVIESSTHWRVGTILDLGSRIVDFYADRNVLTLDSTYCLNRSAVVTDFYWEMINIDGVDRNARVAIGYADGRVQQCAWGVDDYQDVVWVWMQFREWMPPQLIRQMLFTTRQPATLQLREEHGNDILFTRIHSNASFTTEIHFDVPSPVGGVSTSHRYAGDTARFGLLAPPNDERIQTALPRSAATELRLVGRVAPQLSKEELRFALPPSNGHAQKLGLQA